MAYTTLISAGQLASLNTHKNSQPLTVFDCSFDLTQPAAGYEHYLASHIPGALYARLDAAMSSDNALAASGGRHPLPTRESFAAWLASVGVLQNAQIVVYDRNGANYCGRLWWMLKWVGHMEVAVLDGGLQAWTAHGGAVASGLPVPVQDVSASAVFEVRPSPYQLVAADQVASRIGRSSQTLIDARGAPRFRGEVEPLDPIAGHIPGALNRPFAANLGDDGLFKAASQLKAEFEILLAGRDPSTVVHHCGSGVSALPNLLAMEVAGLGRSALYAGSWSDWCSHPDYPMARS